MQELKLNLNFFLKNVSDLLPCKIERKKLRSCKEPIIRRDLKVMIQAFETKLYVGKDSAMVNVKLYNDVLGSVVTLTVIFTGPKAKPNIVNQVSCSGFYQLDKMCST